MQKGLIHPYLIIGIVIVIGLIVAINVIPIINNSATDSPTIEPSPIEETFDNKVEFAKKDGQIYLRYNNKIYTEGKTSEYGYDEPKIIPTPEGTLTWTKLASSEERPDGHSQVFSFKVLPDQDESFLIVMRWAGNVIKEYKPNVYHYHNQKTTEIDLGPSNSLAKIMQISPDGKYAAFTSYVCWNCDGGPKNVIAVDLQTKKKQTIPATIYFKWNSNGAYEYKELISYDCETDHGICIKEEKDLPLKTGQL